MKNVKTKIRSSGKAFTSEKMDTPETVYKPVCGKVAETARFQGGEVKNNEKFPEKYSKNLLIISETSCIMYLLSV